MKKGTIEKILKEGDRVRVVLEQVKLCLSVLMYLILAAFITDVIFYILF
jgi:hypothetical protein